MALFISLKPRKAESETHTKRQVTQHNCLFSLMGNGDKWIEILYGEEKNTLVAARQAQRINQERTPFVWYSRVPVYLSLNSQQGPPLSSLSNKI